MICPSRPITTAGPDHPRPFSNQNEPSTASRERERTHTPSTRGGTEEIKAGPKRFQLRPP